MNDKGISQYEGIALISLYIWGAVFITNILAGSDMWFIIIISFIISIPLLLAYSRIMTNFKGEDLYSILEIVFGKGIGRIATILYTLFFLHLGAIVLRNFIEYIRLTSLNRTPIIITGVAFQIIISYMVRQGTESFGKWAGILIIGITAIAMFLGFFLILNGSDEAYIFLNFYKGFKPTISSVYSFITFPIGEIIVFMTIFDSLKKDVSIYKVFIVGMLFAIVIVLINVIGINLMLIGEEHRDMYFPTFIAVRRIKVGETIQRVETLISLKLAVESFAEVSACLFASCKGISKIFNIKDYKSIATATSLLMLAVSLMLYENTLYMAEWNAEIWPHYSFPFQVLIPIIILLVSELKIRRRKNYGIDGNKN
ncbi:GerAB/ArcD/ProY family transporter [Clostridium sp.]|jgi:spore germination protein KB|uniref:GerAB/ArcD/ProY family transporter n=1 Tax=Clostridium sp. TaxID=1506 RepID=UPI0039F603BB